MKTNLANLDVSAEIERRLDWGELPFGVRRATWMDRIGHRAFALVIALLCAGLYGHTLGDGFLLDDYHHLSRMEALRQGLRDSPDLYRFLVSPESNAAARQSGEYPWWITDDVRYQHWRPAAEWSLYGQYLLFGQRAFAYRLVNLCLYIAGAWLVLALYRRWSNDEAVARRAALLFTVLAGHAIPVVFISSQADLVALLLAAGAMLAAFAFGERGGACTAALSCVLFGAALGFKESVLPMAALPGVVAWARAGAERRRLIGLSGLWLAAGLVWFAGYARGGYGANNAIMLDPFHAPAAYLAALPGRAAVLLASLVIPVNPFVFYLRPGYDAALAAFAAAGVAAFAWCARGVLKDKAARNRWPVVVWPIVFLPLLACTVPDDRVLMLPGIGFSLMIAAWWARRRPRRSRLAGAALWVLVLSHAGAALAASHIMGMIAEDGRESVRVAVAALKRPPAAGDCLVFLNSTVDSQVLFARDRFESITGVRDVHVAFVTSANDPIVERVDDRRIHISARSGGLVDGFLGRMGVSWRRELVAGDEFDAGAYRVVVTEAAGATVKRIELVLADSLASGRYHFFRVEPGGRPAPWPGLP